jgi:hypothetical protein
MRGRVQVQPDDVCCLGLESRIVRTNVSFQHVGLQAVPGPDARNGHVRHAAKLASQLSRRPVRRTIGPLALSSPRQNLGLDLVRYLESLATYVPGKQTCEPVGGEALAPAADVAVVAIELGANLGPRQTIGQEQDQARMPGHICSGIPRRRLPLEFNALALGQLHHVHRGHDVTDQERAH